LRTHPDLEDQFVERFVAPDIELDDDSDSMPYAKSSIDLEDNP